MVPGHRQVHVDRAEQLAHAADIAAARTQRRALFLEGQEGIGKTSLLLEIYRQHTTGGVYFVDLGRMVSQVDVLNELARQARQQEIPVPGYRTARSQFTQSAQVQVNDLRARNSSISLVINASIDRSIQLTSLSDALMENLASDARRPVICLDGFEHCEAPMRDWLGRDLLPDLLTQPGTSVFLAGRNIPRLSQPHVSSVHTMVLPPFGVDAVQEWIDSLGFHSLKRRAVRIHDMHDGIPGLIDEFFSTHIEPHGDE
ncbi:AAA family ATPase [Streptomyces sp. NPDC047079]|uniref:AAA family ATPase n=1 Tax=Streptomyces sp. NPDC047079 TaxID=3154607 RepID=UPI0033E5FE0A